MGSLGLGALGPQHLEVRCGFGVEGLDSRPDRMFFFMYSFFQFFEAHSQGVRGVSGLGFRVFVITFGELTFWVWLAAAEASRMRAQGLEALLKIPKALKPTSSSSCFTSNEVFPGHLIWFFTFFIGF